MRIYASERIKAHRNLNITDFPVKYVFHYFPWDSLKTFREIKKVFTLPTSDWKSLDIILILHLGESVQANPTST